MASVSNIISYIEELSPDIRERLYRSQFTCMAVLRSLHPLAKQYVLRLLWVEEPVQMIDIEGWVKDKRAHGELHRKAMASLEALGLFHRGQGTIRLDPTFQAQIRVSLAQGAQNYYEAPFSVLISTPQMDDLDRYAYLQWESLQLYILTPHSEPPLLSLPSSNILLEELDVHRLLLNADMIHGTYHERHIIDQGFQFLLQDNHHQLWSFLTHYIKDAQHRSGAELASVVSFLMQLGFRRVGQPYPFGSLEGSQRIIAGHMMQLGLLHPFVTLEGELFFCPTRLASSLCGGGGVPMGGAGRMDTLSINADVVGGHVIVETNYRIYAYTTSKVQVALVELFCRKDCVLPNLFVGTLTRESVLTAITRHGITGRQMIDYLERRAHPKVAGRTPVVPEVVTDQILLWELETKRVVFTEATFYENFETLDLFHSINEYCEGLGARLWCSEGRENQAGKSLAAKTEWHNEIKAKIKEFKEKNLQ